jgi:hypothetical protein
MDKSVRNISVSLATIVGAITWVLITFVPAFRSGIPTDISTAIPVVVALIAHYFGFNFEAKRAARKAQASEYHGKHEASNVIPNEPSTTTFPAHA